MNISGSFGEIDKVGGSQSCQSSVDSIEEIVNRGSPQASSIVLLSIFQRVYAMLRDEGNKEAGRKYKPRLPDLSHFLHIFAPVYLGIVKHDECVLPYCKGEPVKGNPRCVRMSSFWWIKP